VDDLFAAAGASGPVFLFNRGNTLIQAEGRDSKYLECDDWLLCIGHDDQPGNPLDEVLVNDCIDCPLRLGKYPEAV